ncbi:5685_t:CDS:10 [Ambispora leptoticha]|uniref:5685_t:CDS:1 n=1 Tax=Ambispora leptoticha TaxID=144679 RepID=A0A9N8YX63_9GLOM|nr:5685_t:CDS:10 [Ambispora leptoticha]
MATTVCNKLYIKNNQEQTIVGILNICNKDTLKRTNGSKLGLILHGTLGHKNYLFQKKLASSLPFDTFRFDFRGNGESEGERKYGCLKNDLDDIETVFDFLQKEYGYSLYALIGHSRGAMAALLFVATRNHNVPYVVNISARYSMEATRKKHGSDAMQALETQGHFYWKTRSRGQEITWKITKEEFSDWLTTPMHLGIYLVKNIPESTSVLTIHGTDDEIIYVTDATIFANLIPNHTLKLIDGANHQYSNHTDELINLILEYYSPEFQSARFLKRNRVIKNVPRMIKIGGVKNFRDLGGWKCTINNDDNLVYYVRPRFVFRSAELSMISEDGIAALKVLNIQKIFDLRSNPNLFKAVPAYVLNFIEDIDCYGLKLTSSLRNLANAQRIHTPVFPESSISREKKLESFAPFTAGPVGFAQVYISILESGKKAFRTIFEHILYHPNSPFLVHCRAGRDRTGVFAMLLLKLARVDDETIAREYEITTQTQGYDENELQIISDKFNTAFTIEECGHALTAQYESMILTLKKFYEKYGNTESYFINELGFTKEEIHQIENNLVEPFLSQPDE